MFYGFSEENGENCENKVRDLLAQRILKNRNINDIKIVRAHRLGKFKSNGNRAIIVKLRDYDDKMQIMRNVGTLRGTKWVATEDFSLNTNKLRENLRSCLLEAKSDLKDIISKSSIRYKAIHIQDKNGKLFVFPDHVVAKTLVLGGRKLGMVE